MSQTGRLGLPYIITSQAQKEVMHNDGLNRLDAFVTPIVSQITDAPPGSPALGELAQYLTGGWVFYAPFKWMDAVVESLDSRITFNGSAWVSFTFNLGSGALQRSTLRSKVNREEHEDVSEQLLRWVWAGGRKLRGLVRRRKAEALFYVS